MDVNGGGRTLGTLAVPATGGWQSWQTIALEADLEPNDAQLGLYVREGGWNLNWLKVTPIEDALDIIIQAEDYTDAFDTTVGNIGGQYRNGDVDIEVTSDEGGGYNIGWIAATEWLSYSNIVIPKSGSYYIDVRVASPNGGQLSVDINSGSQQLGIISILPTDGWQNWQTFSLKTQLVKGTVDLGIYALTDGWNLNWIRVRSAEDFGTPPPGKVLTFSDEFDRIDSSVWTIETGGDGFGNYELQWYSNGDNVRIEYDSQINSNVLVIEARKELGGPCWWGQRCQYTSGKLVTRYKKSFQYGRIEARMKLPRVQGIWPAFWMLGDAYNTRSWPQGGEIDIMEHVNTNNITSGALHGPGYSGSTPITGHLEHSVSIDSTYKVYAIEWDKDGIAWYVDDTEFYRVSKAEVQQYGEYVYDQPFWLLLNMAVGGSWPGNPDSDFPTTRMYVDYIRVYQ